MRRLLTLRPMPAWRRDELVAIGERLSRRGRQADWATRAMSIGKLMSTAGLENVFRGLFFKARDWITHCWRRSATSWCVTSSSTATRNTATAPSAAILPPATAHPLWIESSGFSLIPCPASQPDATMPNQSGDDRNGLRRSRAAGAARTSEPAASCLGQRVSFADNFTKKTRCQLYNILKS